MPVLRVFDWNHSRILQAKLRFATLFSVRFHEATPSGVLTTEICRGDLHDSGKRFKSCLFYDSRIAIFEDTSSYWIIVTPYQFDTLQERNAVFLPIRLPDTNVNMWYEWISNHTIAVRHKATSQYSTESIKGNFDRKLTRFSFKEEQADVALNQFKDT